MHFVASKDMRGQLVSDFVFKRCIVLFLIYVSLGMCVHVSRCM